MVLQRELLVRICLQRLARFRLEVQREKDTTAHLIAKPNVIIVS